LRTGSSTGPLAKLLPVTVALAILALVLGYLGFRAVPQETVSSTDAVYRSLQLFALEGQFPATGVPWQLNAARFLAAAIAAYALVATAIALLRNQAQRLYVRAFARKHVIVVGLGATGIVVARALRKKKHRVVAIEADANSSRTRVGRTEGIKVIVGDATHPPVLKTARVDRARHVVLLTGDDSRNLEVLACGRALCERKGSRRPTFHVALSDVALWRELSETQLSGHGSSSETEFLNLGDRTSQALVAAAVREVGSEALGRVLIAGGERLTARVTAHVVRKALAHERRPSVLLLGNQERPVSAEVAALEPWCQEVASIEEVALTSLKVSDVPDVAFLFADGGDAAALGRAVALARRSPTTEIFVAVYRESSGRALATARGDGRIHIVSANVQALADELLEESGIEILARAKHADYVRRERRRGATQADNNSLKDWADLPESLKESNRRFAQSIGPTLAGLGVSLRPLKTSRPTAKFELPPQQLEPLARDEHERWVRALQSDGWTHGHGPKDPQRKRHPLLVSWEELSEAEREKDRDPFRALPEMLAEVGYEVLLPE